MDGHGQPETRQRFANTCQAWTWQLPLDSRTWPQHSAGRGNGWMAMAGHRPRHALPCQAVAHRQPQLATAKAWSGKRVDGHGVPTAKAFVDQDLDLAIFITITNPFPTDFVENPSAYHRFSLRTLSPQIFIKLYVSNPSAHPPPPSETFLELLNCFRSSLYIV